MTESISCRREDAIVGVRLHGGPVEQPDRWRCDRVSLGEHGEINVWGLVNEDDMSGVRLEPIVGRVPLASVSNNHSSSSPSQ